MAEDRVAADNAAPDDISADDAAPDHVALDQAPADAASHRALAERRAEQGLMAEAVALSRRGAELEPERAESWAHLGHLLIAARRPDSALAPLSRALALQPGLIAALSDMAIACCTLNRYEDAVPHYQQAYRAEPSNNSARYLEALALLALGDHANGWRKHETRWYAELGQDMRARFDGPTWLGEPGIEGQTVLLHAEQGLGDTLQFIRYAPLVKARGARVMALVQAPLAPLLRGMDGVDQVIGYGEDLPGFDTHCALMSLPRAFRTQSDTIPASIPYVAPSPDRLAAWAERLGPRPARRRIALAWSGSTSVWNRAVPLALLAPLLDRDDVEWHAAQTEIYDTDRPALARFPRVIDHVAALADFADTAALLAQMDLVISVDTALAHLAGAMGLPAWTLLPLGADYRWLTTGTTTAWYPTMRLFRQQALCDWLPVIAAVNQALDDPGP